MKTLLITAFEPFGGESENPSMLVLERLSDQIGALRLEKRLLGVTFKGAAEDISQYISEIKPDYAICLGQAGGRAAITPERVAINIMDARMADNSGFTPTDEPVCPAGPDAYFATLPIKRMVKAIEGAGIPAAVSNSAGTYVCNSTMYALLNSISRLGLSTKAGFIHVPYLPKQVIGKSGVASMSLDDMVRGITAAIDCLE